MIFDLKSIVATKENQSLVGTYDYQRSLDEDEACIWDEVTTDCKQIFNLRNLVNFKTGW